MKILITGGTGLIGKELIKKLLLNDHQITIVSRNTKKIEQTLSKAVSCMGLDELNNLLNLNGFDAVINLAGEPIFGKRWSHKLKQTISQSRINMTRKLVDLINNSSEPPSCFISGSAVGIYPSSLQKQNEYSKFNIDQSNFPQTLCENWENSAEHAAKSTRLCIIRTGIVLAKNGGMLAEILPSFRLGMGALLGSGEQYLPFVHIDDEVKAICFLLENKQASGVFNLCAPKAVTNKDFTKKLAKVLARPQFLKLPNWLLTLIFGEAASLMLYSQNIEPQRLLELGFEFKFSDIDVTLADLLI